MWFPFNFAKNLKDRHFVVGGSKTLKLSTNTCFGVSFQKNVFSSLLLFLSVCYQDDLSNSERKKNSKFDGPQLQQQLSLICQIFRNDKPLPKYLTDRKLKMSDVFIFETKGANKNKIFNFLKGSFSAMRGPMDMTFGVFSETYGRLLTSITLQFFS